MPENQPHYTDIKILASSLPALDDQLENNLAKYINDCWTKSVQYRQNVKGYNLTEKIAEVERADRLEHRDIIKKRPKWRSKIYLGWIKQAHIATVAYLLVNLLNGDWFALTGQTSEDMKNAEIMTKVIKYLFQSNYNIRKILVQALYQFVKKGNTVIKGFWQVIKSYVHDYEEVYEEITDPITGELKKIFAGFKQIKKEVKQYNDFDIEYVDFSDFHFFPVTGNFLTATKIHRFEKTYNELKQAKGQYINLDKLEYRRQTSTGNTATDEPIQLKEAWIHNCWIGNIQLSNVIVTLADEKTVIQYKPIPYDYGMCPFLFAPFECIEGSNLGKGLCFDSLPMQDTANLLINMLVDAQKSGTYPMTLIPDGEDIHKFVSQPNAIIEYDRTLFEKGLFPRPMVQDLSKLPLNFQTLFNIKAEFEAQTVPEFIKGVRPQKSETATRDVLVQNGSENRLGLGAENFNELILKALIQLIYILYHQRCKLDPDVRLKIARLVLNHTKEMSEIVLDENNMPVFDENGQPQYEVFEVLKTDEELLEELPDIIPMEMVDVSIDGYRTAVKKQSTIENIRLLMELLNNAGDDIKEKINQEGILDSILLMLDLDKKDFIFSDDEALEHSKKVIDDLAYLESYKALKFQQFQPQQPPQPIQQ